MLYKFANYELDSQNTQLRFEGEIQKIEPQVYLVLELLISNHDRIVTKQEIIDYVWNGRIVSDGAIDNRISNARTAIGDSGHEQGKIKTFQGRGFKFVESVQLVATTKPSDATKFNPIRGTFLKNKSLAKYLIVGLMAFGALGASWMFLGSDSNLENAKVDPDSVEGKFQSLDRSIAVMPFFVVEQDSDSEYLGEGLAEDLINVLATVNDLHISSRTSSFSFMDSNLTVSEIAKELNVRYIVEGTIRKSGDLMRINVHLIDGFSGRSIWHNSYNEIYSAENILSMQDDVSSKIATRISVEFGLDPMPVATKIRSTDAYSKFLQGRERWRERTPEGFAEAERLLKESIEIDPDYIPAYVILANNYYDQIFFLNADKDFIRGRIREVIEDIASLTPDENADILILQAKLIETRYENRKAIELVERALVLNPNHAEGHHYLGRLLHRSGRLDEALNHYSIAHDLSPLSENVLSNYAFALISKGDLPEAIKIAETNLKWHPDSFEAQMAIGKIYGYNADYVRAHHVFKNMYESFPESFAVQPVLAELYANVGLEDLAFETATSPIVNNLLKVTLGKCDQVLSAEDLREPLPDLTFFYYLCGHKKLAYPQLKILAQADQFSNPDYSLNADELITYIILTDVLKANDDPNYDRFINRLEDYFADKPVDTLHIPDQLFAGAALFTLKDEPKKAWPYIDALVDYGFPYMTLKDVPVFQPLAQLEAYESRQSGFIENAARHRKSIERQLAALNGQIKE